MEAIIERCCGLDVHQASITATLLLGRAGQKPKKEVREFGTTTRELCELRDWLKSAGCTHVGMESTGIYWRPVYAVLEGEFTLVVGNAQRIKNVPGRKTDVKDSEWIADLVRHGLIAASIVLPKPFRELRDLLRYRTKLVQTRSSERNRLLKLLETANIKLSSVATNVFGVSGMLMLKALLAGELTPGDMAQLAKGRLRKKLPELERALEGRIEDHHRFMLKLQLARLEQLEDDLAQLDARIDQKLEPHRAAHRRLMTIPGVDKIVAAVLVAEIGTNMDLFRGPHQLASWAGVCPGNNESAGRRMSGRARKGNAHLRAHLVQAALSAGKTGGTYLKDKYYRLRARRGAKRAALAIAHKMLVAAYFLLLRGEDYKDLGEAYLDDQSKRRVRTQLVRRLERMGYAVELRPAAA